MKFDDLLTMVKEDLKIDQDNLQQASIDTPILHNKYYQYYLFERAKLRRLVQKQKTLIRDKWEFYTGKAPPEKYKDKEFSLKLLKQDVDRYIDADQEYQELEEKIALQNDRVEFLKETISMIANRTWQVKNIIEALKYYHGG